MKFRASYSILSLWANGQIDEAIKAYFKIDRFITPAMEEGLKYHKEWEKEVKKGHLPKIFSGLKLNNPQPELKLTAQINDWLELVGVIDTLEDKKIMEFKTGVKTSNAYLKTMQMPLYKVLCHYNDIEVTKGILYHYNQHTNEVDVSIQWLTQKKHDEAMEWLITLASDMHSHLVDNDLYSKYS